MMKKRIVIVSVVVLLVAAIGATLFFALGYNNQGNKTESTEDKLTKFSNENYKVFEGFEQCANAVYTAAYNTEGLTDKQKEY